MISVIVPVYNVEKYLSRCVDSILHQTYKDFELILVDDGSSDKCPQICDDYAQYDQRVRVIHKENGGLSDARNVGTEAAKGEYLIFIDSDDWIRQDSLEVLVSAAEKYDAQVSLARFILVFEDEEQPDMKIGCALDRCLSGGDALKEILYGRLFGTTACGYLIKTDVARAYPFPIGKYNEDDFTTFNYYLASKTVAVIDADLYYYFQRSGSIMHREDIRVVVDQLDAADYIKNSCIKEGGDIIRAAGLSRFSSYCQVLLDYKYIKNDYPDVYRRILAGIREEAPKVVKDTYAGKKKRIGALCFMIGRKPFLQMVACILQRKTNS